MKNRKGGTDPNMIVPPCRGLRQATSGVRNSTLGL